MCQVPLYTYFIANMMLPKSEYVVKGLVWNCCVISFLLLATQPESSLFAESKRLRSRFSRIRNNRGVDAFSNFDGRTVHKGRVSQELIRLPVKHVKIPHGKRHRHLSSKSRKGVKIERISHSVLNFPDLSRLINPSNHKTGINRLSLPPSDKSYLRDHDRRRRLYCRGGIGYHLEILSNGKVVGRHRPTDNGILKIFSTSHGIVGMRVEKHMRYLCMNRRGRLYSSKTFGPECQFRETIEANHFNTYASNRYSDYKNKKGYYLSLTKRGKVRSNKKVSAWQKRAHWLPREVTT